MPRVTAEACKRQIGLDSILREAGFIRSKVKTIDCRYGTEETWRTYEVQVRAGLLTTVSDCMPEARCGRQRTDEFCSSKSKVGP